MQNATPMQKQQRILLVEPKTRTTYPPLGLMKLATYHKLRGDIVEYVIGKNKDAERQPWDKIYITSIFTYDFKILVDTVKFYGGYFPNENNIYVGGISATILKDKLTSETSAKVHAGLLDSANTTIQGFAKSDSELKYLETCTPSIDNLPPDYGIIQDATSSYSKIIDNAFFFFASKGCPNRCKFCAVQILEPRYVDYIPIRPRIEYIKSRWGDKAGLLLLDNNIAASTEYFRILDEIKDCGFYAGAKMTTTTPHGKTIYKKRFVDFNQGVDLRLMDNKKMKKMAEIAIQPLRLAFDSSALASEYEHKARLAIDSGILNLSNYMLYNFKDSPEDLYSRFEVNIKILRDNPSAKIFSFPMRYSPVNQTDRTYIGQHWSKREVRAVQLIIHATHGIVSHKLPFFYRAFGRTLSCFKKVLLYPYHYLINRDTCELKNMLIQQWENDFEKLSPSEVNEFREIIRNGPLQQIPATNNRNISRILEHYENERATIRKDNEFTNSLF